MLIHVPSYTFFLLNAGTIVLAYAKLEGDLFFFTWMMTLAPTLLYLFLMCLKYLKDVTIIDEAMYKEVYGVKTNRFQLLDNFFHLVLSLLMLFFVGYSAHFLDAGKALVSRKPMYIAVTLYLATQLAYTIVSNRLEKEGLPITNEKKDTSLFMSIMSPILNFLGSSFVLCSGGTCSSIYGSTISAIFSAFGISISEWMPFLDWFTFLLVIVSVVVLYYAKKSLTYKPFLLSCVAAILIFADTLYFQMRYPIYVGNVLMITAAIWNSRLNKAGFMFFGKKKKAAVPIV